MTNHRPSTIQLRTSLLADAIAIVAAEYGSQLSLDDLARRVASSRRQLQRAYAEIGGTTFREHLTRVRMDRAADLLRETRLAVREVAHHVGYRQPAQFAKAFRRHAGAAPAEYRARAQAAQPPASASGITPGRITARLVQGGPALEPATGEPPR